MVSIGGMVPGHLYGVLMAHTQARRGGARLTALLIPNDPRSGSCGQQQTSHPRTPGAAQEQQQVVGSEQVCCQMVAEVNPNTIPGGPTGSFPPL